MLKYKHILIKTIDMLYYTLVYIYYSTCTNSSANNAPIFPPTVCSTVTTTMALDGMSLVSLNPVKLVDPAATAKSSMTVIKERAVGRDFGGDGEEDEDDETTCTPSKDFAVDSSLRTV